MYAIVEIAAKQFKVQENTKVYVPHLSADVDSTLTLDRVLLVSGDDGILVGAPLVDGVTISAKVLRHVKGDKILVFKKKRRKRYKVKRGHRQQYTQLLIDRIATDGAQEEKKQETADAEA